MDQATRTQLATAFERILDASSVVTDPADTEAYSHDYSSNPGRAELVVKPRTAADVAAVLGYCGEHRVAVVPSGGRTGFSGGATPGPGAIVLSLERLDSIEPVDTVAHTVRVGAGAITQDVHDHCEAAGLTWPIDLASRGSSQIGGNISTNAGGINVVRYGMTRNWVLGLEVATLRGELLRLDRPLVKNNTGWDIMQLFIGSEGTLGVITSAVLKLAPAVDKRCTAFFALRDEMAMAHFVETVRAAPFALLALEYLDQPSLRRAVDYYQTPAPIEVQAPYYVVVEYELAGHRQDDIEDWLSDLEVDGIEGAVVAQGEKQRASIWLMREGLGEAWVAMGSGRTHDVSVPVSQAAEFLRVLRERAAQEHPDWAIYGCGHLGDGNIHTHLRAPDGLGDAQLAQLWDQFDDFVFRIVTSEYRGSVSAEHGIGLSKKKYLPWCRSPAELDIFRAV
ncbi:MAG: FAD-binding oxidoreductase, partial [Deltaproteobacteria bacterium]|nr:FAD-binding oxidoreductase [Deltaproteobacteria bacterium]